MKRILSLILAGVVMIGVQSCKSNKNVQKEEKKVAVANAVVASPPVILYKTKKDYSKMVPVILNEEKTQITSYPSPSDLKSANKFKTPLEMEHGFLLDQRGINERVAFLNISYEDYSKLKEVPSSTELFDMILDKDPLAEMYKCGKKGDYKNLEKEINIMILEGKLSQFERMK